MTELEFYKSIGAKIKDFRKSKKLTQAEVSQLANVDRSMLARLESAGEGIKSADIIRRIVEATGHTMEDLFSDGKKKQKLTLTLPVSQRTPLNV